jgi:iron(III) transport system substrate-binding protein
MNSRKALWRRLLLIAAAVVACGDVSAVAADEVNIYSYRQERLIKPQLDAFTAATGIKYRLITGGEDALAERIKREDVNSPADVLLTVDAGRLVHAKNIDILQPVRSAALEAAIPSVYRDPEGYWFGLGLRARLIFYAVDRVKPTDIATYDDLTAAKWKGKLLIRSSNSIYNQSLLAAMIHNVGAAKAEEWARDVAANMARKPQGGDTDQLLALAAGVGDLAVSNQYYYVRLQYSDVESQRQAAAKIRPLWPDQAGRGAHINISGAGVAKHSKNREAAVKLIEFLASAEAQKIYAEVGYEFPVRPGVPAAPALKALGDFKADTLPLKILGDNNAEAVRIFDRVGWR